MKSRKPSTRTRNSRVRSSAAGEVPSRTARIVTGVCGVFAFCLVGASIVYAFGYSDLFSDEYDLAELHQEAVEMVAPAPEPKVLDREEYDRRLALLANNPPVVATSTASTTPDRVPDWSPVPPFLYPTDAPYPKVGAILPFHRIVAYYGNFYSTKMGALGEYPADEMIERLQAEVRNWEEADPETPVMPAIDYIAVTAQGSAGEDGMYRLRMPHDQIDHALALAKRVDGIVILEVQAGLSPLQREIETLEKYLMLPQVHLAIDPEFAMKTGDAPGTVIGTVDAVDVNSAAEYLATLVQEHDLPPKVLIVHRFTQKMVTNYDKIAPLPEVQIVMDMDGWGTPERKFGTYNWIVAPEPVQFTGFKLFYKNDLKPPSRGLLTPKELLELRPRPIFIQYQ